MTEVKVGGWVGRHLLVLLTVVGVVVGGTIGLAVRRMELSQDVLIWIGLPGEVYMNSLKMVILPLIVSSVITGTASMDPKCNGRISVISLCYIVLSNCLTCVLPIAITLVTGLGKGAGEDVKIVNLSPRVTTVKMETSDVFADLIRNIFPSNVVSACFEQAQTKYETVILTPEYSGAPDSNFSLANNLTQQLTNNLTQQRLTTQVLKTVGTAPATNVLGLLICSFLLGVATSSLGQAGKPFLEFFQATNAVIIKMMGWLVWSSPVGVASLIAVALLRATFLESVIQSLGLFVATVTGCLVLHVTLISVIVHVIILRTNPFPFLASLHRPCIVAFSSCSGAVAFPETLQTLEKENGLDSRVTRFTLPLAVTINRDGTCVFIPISCLFVTHLAGFELNAGQLFMLWILTTVLSLATPSVPSGSIVCIIILLTTLGIPTELVGVLFTAEWLLDRLRTTVNVIGHSFAIVFTCHMCRHHLPPLAAQGNGFQEEKEILIEDNASPEAVIAE